jgi:hypothetical protein
MIGPPLQRLLASLLMGVVLVVSYWLAMENIPAAMLAEADQAKVMVAGRREKPLARLIDLCITRERWRKHDPETLKATQKGGPRMSGKAGDACLVNLYPMSGISFQERCFIVGKLRRLGAPRAASQSRGDQTMTPIQAAYRAKIARDTLPCGQRPTDLHVRIMFVLARWQHATPSHAKLAKAAHCHRNSVGNALQRLRGLGLVTWEPRHIRIGGGHFVQASNRYLFPSNTSLPPARPVKFRKDEKMSSFIGKQSLCIGDPEAAQAALATRRRVMEARMLAGSGTVVAIPAM